MVEPWISFPLNALLGIVNPTSKAKYLAFQSLYDKKEMPLASYAGIPFPYVAGLRIDEAMHLSVYSALGSMVKLCYRRMVRRFASWCPGSTD
jgi:sulfoxide reductase catalytic subunit YedY